MPVSSLEHWSYCPRQCGLIHLESVWEENVFTIRGAAVHERVDEPTTRSERGVRVERALPIWSDAHGLIGQADVVEFVGDGAGAETPIPVEYKSGGPSQGRHAALQLCAQALCLEEMFGVSVRRGFLFFARTRERREWAIDSGLRSRTLQAIEEVRRMLASRSLPAPVRDGRCRDCSLVDACMPGLIAETSRHESPFIPTKEHEVM